MKTAPNRQPTFGVELRAPRSDEIKDAGSRTPQACSLAREQDRRPRTRRSSLLGAALVALCALAAAPSANATYDPIGSGTTKLTLAPSFARLLASNGVTLQATQGAKRKARAYTLPVSGGSLDPTAKKGEVEAGGSLVFARGSLRVPLREIVVRTKREPLIAKVGGSQLKLASAKKRDFTRAGFGSTIAAKPLHLTAKLATRLAKKLRLHDVFVEGQLLGTLRVEATPQTFAVLPVGRATLVPDPAFLAKIDSYFVSLNPIAPAERSAGPLFSFPIIGGGQLAPDAGLGTLRTGGALEFLQLGSGQVFWTEQWFDLGTAQVLAEAQIEPTPAYPGKLGQLPLLGLAPGSVSSDPSARTITVSGTPLALNATAAAHFNLAFAAGKEVFHAGEPLGAVSFIAQTQ